MIHVRGLRKSFGAFEAVRGIDLDVGCGEVFAFVGPNGAGKTTTVEMLEGYLSRSAGEAEVLGVDPHAPTRAWRSRIGVVLQTCQLPPMLTVRELVSRYASYYPAPRAVEETITLVGLDDKSDTRAGRLSGGQQRRLDVALALVGDPELVFLDEPTTGFDPAARHQFWGVISDLRGLGKTIFLTTHYMDEAQALADRVAVIAAGQIVAEGHAGDCSEDAIMPPARSDFACRSPSGRVICLPGWRSSSSPGTVSCGFAPRSFSRPSRCCSPGLTSTTRSSKALRWCGRVSKTSICNW